MESHDGVNHNGATESRGRSLVVVATSGAVTPVSCPMHPVDLAFRETPPNQPGSKDVQRAGGDSDEEGGPDDDMTFPPTVGISIGGENAPREHPDDMIETSTELHGDPSTENQDRSKKCDSIDETDPSPVYSAFPDAPRRDATVTDESFFHSPDSEATERLVVSPSDIPDHLPAALPTFSDPHTCMWTSTYAANAPSEDRNSSLVNVLLRPKSENNVLIRLSLWSVIDGHGGDIVADYVSEVLCPHIAASVSQALECEIVERGVCMVNGELRDANALDFDKLIDTSRMTTTRSFPYHAPRDESEDDGSDSDDGNCARVAIASRMGSESKERKDHPSTAAPKERDSSLLSSLDVDHALPSESASVSTSVSHEVEDESVGMHSTCEVAKVTSAVTDSFLSVDEGWINSVDSRTSRQRFCETNGLWNAGACALVALTLQRLAWTGTFGETANDNSRVSGFSSPVSSDVCKTSHGSTSECEATATEEDGGEGYDPKISENVSRSIPLKDPSYDAPSVCPSGGSMSHGYRSHPAMLYSAWVGDCRAVMLSTSPPLTVKIMPNEGIGVEEAFPAGRESDSINDSSSDEADCWSCSDDDEESGDDDCVPRYDAGSFNKETCSESSYMQRPSRRSYALRSPPDRHSPFVPLPPAPSDRRGVSAAATDGTANQHTSTKPLPLTSVMRAIDLTTDHSACNPVEVKSVLRRCNGAPRAICTNSVGGIKRVAGSLAVTRALGDAYLKTSRLSFPPYKKAVPYITARPEVNSRLLTKSSDRVLVLCTDGVWDHANGADVLCWARSYSDERIADDKQQKQKKNDQSSSGDLLTPSRKRKRTLLPKSSAADMIVHQLLHKVRRGSNFPSLRALRSLPHGQARRSRHDDITVSVVDMPSFVS